MKKNSISKKTCSLSLLVLFIGVVLFVATPIVGNAQSQELSADISLSMNPTEPNPLQSVTIKAQSFSINLNQATLSWQYNNQTIGSGVGKTSVTVTAPASGNIGVVTLTVRGGGVISTTSTLILRPASVDLLWEAADAYTPPFYKGKALLPTGGIMRLTAVPSASAPTGVSYTWSRDEIVQQESSGYKKNSFVVKQNILKPQEKISFSAQTGGFSGAGSVFLSPRNPSLIAYQKYEGFIDYAHGSTGTIESKGTGAVVQFEPYYFSTQNGIGNSLSFDFSINGENTLGTGEGNELRFSRSTSGSSATIETAVETLTYSLQNLRRIFTLTFN